LPPGVVGAEQLQFCGAFSLQEKSEGTSEAVTRAILIFFIAPRVAATAVAYAGAERSETLGIRRAKPRVRPRQKNEGTPLQRALSHPSPS